MQDSAEEQPHFEQSICASRLPGAGFGLAMATAARRVRSVTENFILAILNFGLEEVG